MVIAEDESSHLPSEGEGQAVMVPSSPWQSLNFCPTIAFLDSLESSRRALLNDTQLDEINALEVPCFWSSVNNGHCGGPLFTLDK